MRLIGKAFALLLAGILTLILLAFDLWGRIMSFIGVLVIFLFVICLIVIIASGLWHNLPILMALFAVCLIIFFGSAYLAGVIQCLRDSLLGR